MFKLILLSWLHWALTDDDFLSNTKSDAILHLVK